MDSRVEALVDELEALALDSECEEALSSTQASYTWK